MKESLNKLAPLLILLAALAVYARSLPAPYVWDDVSLIAQNKTLDDPANIPRYFVEDLGHFNRDPREMGFYRPMQALTFHIETMLFGRLPSLQRTVNLLFHALAAIAVWLLALSLSISPTWALLAGLLYAVHPLCTEQVILIANRGGVMAESLSLWTLALLVRAVPEKEGLRHRFLFLAAIAYLIALLTKTTALIVPAPAAALLWFARPQRRSDRFAWMAMVALPALLAVAFAIWQWEVLGISHAHKAEQTDMFTRLLTIPRLTIEALHLSLIPGNLRAIRSIDYQAWSSWPSVALSIVAWLLLFTLAWRARHRSPAIPFAAVLFASAIAPSSGLVALVRPVAEHYYYFPTAAVPLAIAGIGSITTRNKYALTVTLLLFGLYSLGTVLRCGDWLSEERLWTDNLLKEPENTQVLNNIGTIKAETGKFDEAFLAFEKAAKLNPANFKSQINRVNLGINLERYEGLDEALAIVLAKEPCNAKALVQLGRLFILFPTPTVVRMAEYQDATFPCARLMDIGKGVAFEQYGRNREAARYYRAFAESSPSDPLAESLKRKIILLEKTH